MKICFVVPFLYLWGNSSNVRCNYEYLKNIYDVDLYTKKELRDVDLNNYDLIMLCGSGSVLTDELYKKCTKPIFGFGFSDPNLFNETHYNQSHIYFTNDLNTYNLFTKNDVRKKLIYYQTSCNKQFHKNLNLEKTNDVLVFGCGNHNFITNRNETVNKLRKEGFKIRVFGRGWDKHPDTHGFIEGEEFIREINQAHIVLDIMNETSSWAHRILEASACATPVLTIDREDTRSMFEENKEILLYKNLDDITTQLIRFLLRKNTLRGKAIGLNAQTRCYKDHDISIRIQELIKIIEEIK